MRHRRFGWHATGDQPRRCLRLHHTVRAGPAGIRRVRELAKLYRADHKMMEKWRKREGVADLPTGTREPKTTVLGPEEAAFIVAFRKHTLLALDNSPCSLQVKPSSAIGSRPMAGVGTH